MVALVAAARAGGPARSVASAARAMGNHGLPMFLRTGPGPGSSVIAKPHTRGEGVRVASGAGAGPTSGRGRRLGCGVRRSGGVGQGAIRHPPGNQSPAQDVSRKNSPGADMPSARVRPVEVATMKRRTLWIGVSLVLVVSVGLLIAARGRGEKGLEVQTEKVSRSGLVQEVKAS